MNTKIHFLLGITSLGLSIAVTGCNLWGGTEHPETKDEKIIVARAKLDEGDCTSARDLMESLQDYTDSTNTVLGWAYLCLAGAKAQNIASSLYKYQRTSTDYTGVGLLARTMVPMDASKLQYLDQAIFRFSMISDSRTRDFQVAMARLSKAAGILARQATLNNSDGLVKTQIADSSCTSVADCTAGCVVTSSGTMSDGDITSFAATIGESAASFGPSQAEDLISLAGALQIRVTGVAANIARCYIYKEIVP